jgi:hypothetical protein
MRARCTHRHRLLSLLRGLRLRAPLLLLLRLLGSRLLRPLARGRGLLLRLRRGCLRLASLLAPAVATALGPAIG